MRSVFKPTIVHSLAVAVLLAGPALGQDQSQPEAHSYDPPLPENMTLDATLDFAADGPPSSWPSPIHDNPVLSFTLIELLEYRISDDRPDEIGWDSQGWIGNDDRKFWWKSEGASILDGPDQGEADVQALYAEPLGAFWFLQAGIRYEQTWSPGDTDGHFSGVLGVQGLAPYRFDVEPTLYLTDDGDLLAQLTTSYDLYVTQRVVLQPRFEFNLSAQDVSDAGLGAGFNDLSLDLRLRYEIHREFAPYIGVRYTTLLGETANIAERLGEDVDELLFVLGVRIAF
jgi:copper resistance protein B